MFSECPLTLCAVASSDRSVALCSRLRFSNITIIYSSLTRTIKTAKCAVFIVCSPPGHKALHLPLTTLYPFIDTEPPVIDRCRLPPMVQAIDTETAVVWEVPQFSDNSGMSGHCSQTAAP